MKKLLIILLPLIIITSCRNESVSSYNSYSIKGNTSTLLQNTNLEISVDSISELEEVKPEKPSGYYNYYEDKKDYHYYVITGILKNPNEKVVNTDNFKVLSMYNNKQIYTKFTIENYARSTLIFKEDTIAKEIKFHIIALVKDGDKNPNKFKLYYQDNLIENDNDKEWDNCLTIIP